ncbi:DUF995 domain-containing protein [Aminobacter sp. P9b]|uniref:DUF995 domain-containing protein n=1 Tax=Aminobacter sp. P9b TaxID=3133697 RepID=UPI00324FBCC9
MSKSIIGLSALVVVLIPVIGWAEELPKDAVPLTASEVRELYSGKSANWSRSRAYFAPDSTFLMHGKDKSWFGEGKWTVKGNEVCGKLKRTSVKDGKSNTGGDCWAWYRVGKKYMTFWSGEKDKKYGYYDSELKKMSAGDKVSKTVAELKKKSGS